MKRVGIVFVLAAHGFVAINSAGPWDDVSSFHMALLPESPIEYLCFPQSSNMSTCANSVHLDVSYQAEQQGPSEGFTVMDQIRELRQNQAREDCENFSRQENTHSSSQKDTALPTDSVQPLGGRPRSAQASQDAPERTPRSALSNPHAERGKPLWKPCAPKVAARLPTPNKKFEHSACPPKPWRRGAQTTTVSAKAQNLLKTIIAKKNALQQKNGSVREASAHVFRQKQILAQNKQLYTNYCSQLDSRTLDKNSYQIIDKRVRALKATLDHPGQLHERSIKISAQERTVLTKSGVPAAALAPLRGNAAQAELHEEYTSVFEQWAKKSHEIRRSLVQETISQITLQFGTLADEFTRSNKLAGGYAMADVMHAAWQSVQELCVFAKATAQVDYEVAKILGSSGLDGVLCAGCSTAQMVAHPLQTAGNLLAALKTLGVTIAHVAYKANILLGNDEQRIAQTRAELFAMLKKVASDLRAQAQSQHPLMTMSDCVSGGTQVVAEGVMASKCLTLSAGVLDKSAQALKKLPELAKASAVAKAMADRASGSKIRSPLTGPQRELALAHVQASIGEGFAEEMTRAQTGISKAGAPKKPLASTILKQEQQAAQKIPAQPTGASVSSGLQPQKPAAPVSSSGLQPAVPEKPTIPAAFPGPLPAPGSQQLLKVFALPEQQRAAIVARYGNPIQEIGGGQFKNPLHLIAIDVRKIDQKTGIVKEWMGFHHDYQHVLERNNIVSFPDKLDYGGGFYFVEAAKYGMQKPLRKSFFPADWPPEKVFEKVIEAHNNIKKVVPAGGGRQELIGWLEHEQKAISIIIDDNKNIITAYPNFFYKKL